MKIELGNIHTKWKLLIEDTCMLPVNGNETMWNGTEFGEYGCFTNKGETNYMEGVYIVKLIVTGDGDHETTYGQNGPCNLHQAYPARVLMLTA
jgi:hypothetical protein